MSRHLHPAAQPWPKWEAHIDVAGGAADPLWARCLWCTGELRLFGNDPGQLADRMTRHDEVSHPAARQIAVAQ